MSKPEKPQQLVKARLPQMVFFGGVLLPHGTFRIDQSTIDPTICDVWIIPQHPQFPGWIRDKLATLPPTATDFPPELQGARVFLCIVAQSGMGDTPAFIEVVPRWIKIGKLEPVAEAPKTAPVNSS